jgi:hypothetical protein
MLILEAVLRSSKRPIETNNEKLLSPKFRINPNYLPMSRDIVRQVLIVRVAGLNFAMVVNNFEPS